MYYGGGWRRQKADRRRAARNNVPLTLARVSAQIQVRDTDEVITGRVFLHDLTEDGMGLFLTAPVSRGSEVFVVIEAPRHLFIRGEVSWCALYRLNTRVISAENFQYRAGIKFTFESEDDRKTVQKYFKDIVT